jgi:hypothetical protein
MAAAVRNFRIWGYVLSPTVATVTINGNEAFNGAIDVDPLSPPTDPLVAVPLIYGSYNGDDTENQILKVAIEVVSGSSAFGNMEVDYSGQTPWRFPDRSNPSSTGLPDLGRSNILINGEPPSWPTNSDVQPPGGTPENPEWGGWTFQLSPGDVLTFDYLALEFVAPPWAIFTEPGPEQS